MNHYEEQDHQRRMDAMPRLASWGFEHVEGWLFKKNGVTYDLSAADLNQLDRIERERLFVVKKESRFDILYDFRHGYVIRDRVLNENVGGFDSPLIFREKDHAQILANAMNAACS